MEHNWNVGLSISDWKNDQSEKVTVSFASQMGSLNNEQKLWCSTQSQPLSEHSMGQVMCLLRALFSCENGDDNASLTELLWLGLLTDVSIDILIMAKLFLAFAMGSGTTSFFSLTYFRSNFGQIICPLFFVYSYFIENKPLEIINFVYLIELLWRLNKLIYKHVYSSIWPMLSP